MCSHGLSMHLLGGAADATTCGVALAAAATTATLRVVSDNHYATDVLAGSAMGLLSGLAMPLFFHYRVPSPSADSTARHPSSNPLRAFGVVPMVAPGGFGLSVSAVTF
jgi:membrane-associated phospholipid phosphatase